MAGDLRVDVQHNLKSVVARFAVESQRLIDASTVRALNRTATTVRAAAVKGIRARYNLKAGAIRRQMKLTRATRTRLVSEVVVSGRRIPLIEFSARQVRRGVTVRVTKQRKLIRGVFVARMPSGHVGVFERQGKERLPIRQLFSLSLPQAFTQKQIMTALKRVAAERFNIELARDLKYRMGKLNG